MSPFSLKQVSLKQAFLLTSVISSCGFSALAVAQAEAIEEVFILGVRDNRISEGATGLALDIQSTPQSISVVSREMMDNYGAASINEALDLAPGLSVERWETNRTNYLSRGFEIKSTQVDGVGMPNSWGLVEGEIDSYGYEKVEVIRGANGLLTGVGNASGTINYVRKRPLNSAQGEVGVQAGSYDNYRLQADYSTPFNASASWAGRVVLAVEESGSYIDGKLDDRAFVYAVVDGQVGDNGTLAFGYSYQEANSEGNMWGGLVFTNSDGTQAEWSRSATTAQNWTYWDNTNETGFIEYTYHLPKDWNLKLSYDYRALSSDSELFFAYTTTGLDPTTGEGLVGWPGKWPSEDEADILEIKLSGGFSAWGQDHQLIAGFSQAKTENVQYQYPFALTEPAYGPLPAFPYALNAIPRPQWQGRVFSSATDDSLDRAYAALQLSVGLANVIAGVNAIDFTREATALGNNLKESEVSPYLGITVDLTDRVMGYVSYSDIYQPQDYLNANDNYLAPTKGENYELGVKATWLDDRLISNLAVFKADQQGLGVYAGFNPNTGQYFYTGEDIVSEGVELEISGQINDYVQVSGSLTRLDIENQQGETTYQWVPETSAKFSLSAQLPSQPDVALGLSGRWQDDTSRVDSYTGGNVKQGAYAVFDVFAHWDVNSQSRVKLNVKNLANEKYITSLYEIGYYAAPRTYELSYQLNF
ncbi:TonB-dependent siderophore receptor [Halioxenophilus aromaticivorans]|uniref:TonB-dependent siderophore receptor n=1 Tax=Halioxenophilus aromaticivorans TaxID=1306992 RepID=A0AAV3U407_9ALTE